VRIGGERVDGIGLVFALVAFEGPGQKAIARVVTPFESAKAADAFARSAGLEAYAVGPVDFPVPLLVPEQRS
jgi:hypothetical protein